MVAKNEIPPEMLDKTQELGDLIRKHLVDYQEDYMSVVGLTERKPKVGPRRMYQIHFRNIGFEGREELVSDKIIDAGVEATDIIDATYMFLETLQEGQLVDILHVGYHGMLDVVAEDKVNIIESAEYLLNMSDEDFEKSLEPTEDMMPLAKDMMPEKEEEQSLPEEPEKFSFGGFEGEESGD